MNIFNEILSSIYLYAYIILTDFNDNDAIKESAGFAFVAILAISALVNIIYTAVNISFQVKFTCKMRRYLKRKQ